MPTLLTEKSGVLSYIKEDASTEGKHYLGKLAGIGGGWLKPTRNGRRYPLELWENIEKSDDFKEGMETHTIFGETDHPETRVETSIKEIAIVLTKYEIRRTEGIVYTEFHILNTPNGRILKELLDYGSQIGVSTRGLGDEIERDGETIIDPDTYCFFGWDAVVMPAVKAARPAVVESSKRSLIESVSREIESATCAAELESIKRVASTIKLPELDSIIESIDIKLNSISEEDNILSKLEEDLGEASTENIRLSEEIDRLNSIIAANNIRLDKSKKVIEGYRKANKSLSESLQRHMVSSARMQTELFDSAEEVERISESRKSEKRVYESRLREKSKELTEAKQDLARAKSECASLSNKVSSLTETVSTLRKSSAKTSHELGLVKEQLKNTQSNTTLVEKKSNDAIGKYKKALHESKASESNAIDKYLELKCSQMGIKSEVVRSQLPSKYTIEDIDHVTAEVSDRKRRFDKLSFDTTSAQSRIVGAKLVESNNFMSDEDRQTMEFIKSSMNIL